MAYTVCEEDLDQARDEASAALDATRRHPSDPRRYNWLYRDNPDGPAVLWSIRKDATGEMAGFTVVLPRRVLVDGQPQVCWNGADFSIYPKFRALGVAIKLRRAAKDGIDHQRADFLYAHPNAKMQLIHERVGHSPVGKMVRYALPLRAEPYVRDRIGNQAVAGVAGKLVDAGWRLARLGRSHRYASETTVIETPTFDDRFDRLFDECNTVRRVIGIRDGRYLRWRYGDNPLYETHAVLAETDGQLCGYALFMVEDGVAHVKDVLVAGDDAIRRDLLARLIDHARRAGLKSISAVVLDGHPLIGTLEAMGFSKREGGSKMFGYAPDDSPLRDIVLDSDAWLVSVGDRDV